ncbi:MAG: flagellar filament capping protein FliD [Sulfuritalea sp.]|nr:flagellar filament capping protein FliD [Sulfuritalea sp.]
MGISSVGLGSGLDVNSIITGLMGVEKKPLTAVAQQKSAYQSKISAYGTMKSSLSLFQTTMSTLSNVAKFNMQTATSADTSIFTASTDGTATNGDYAITVSQLAKSQKLALTGFDSITDTVNNGRLNIDFGRYDPTDDNKFTANPDKSSLSITINSSNRTLAGVRDAINAANASVTASIVNNGSGNQLVLTSTDTGEVNSMRISGISQLAYDKSKASNGNNDGSGDSNGSSNKDNISFTEVQAAKNALLNVDGVAVAKASNTITDVINGVTLNLLSTSSGNNINLHIASNQNDVKASISSFVDAYNKLDTTLRSLTKFDSTGKASGVLLGDGTARSVVNQIKSVMTKAINTTGGLTTLNQIGVTFQRDGQLALDSTRLTAAMNSNFGDIATLFASSLKATDAQITYAGSTSNTQEGTYAVTVTKLGTSSANTAGTINGVAATGSLTGLTGATGNASSGLSLKISGGALGSRGTVQFTMGYAAQLDRVINSLLSDTGIVASKTEGLNTSITRLDKKTESLNIRLAGVEARYRTQFTKLDSLLSGMSTTSSYLTQQLASINANK